MPGIAAALAAFGAWLVKRLVVLLVGSVGIYAGWESGILPKLLRELLVVLMDLVFIFADSLLAFFYWVISDVTADVPDAFSVMAYIPVFAIEVGSAIGLWSSMAGIMTALALRGLIAVLSLRVIFR